MADNKTGAGQIPKSGGDVGSVLLQSVLSTVLPAMLGAGNTTKKRASPEANAQAGTAFKSLTTPQDYTGQTADILTRAAQEFAPTLAFQHGAGLYDSTMTTQLSSETQARATAAAQQAILQDKTSRDNAAANLAGASMQANNDTTQGNSIDLGQTLLAGGAMLAAPFLMKQGKGLIDSMFGTGGASAVADALTPGSMAAGQIQGMGTEAMKELSQVFDPSMFNMDVADPLAGALTSGVGDSIGKLAGGDFGSSIMEMFNGTGAAGDLGGMGGLDIFSNLMSGNYGQAAVTGLGYAFGGPMGGFIGNLVGGMLGCFLTTAVCDSTGLPDDNEYLTTLRQFRDGYMQMNYPWMIEEYYQIAPAITNYIKQRPDSDAVFKNMFHLYIVPAVARIKNGDNQGAMQVYKALVQYAKSQANLVAEV